jgi:hypothetical protein
MGVPIYYPAPRLALTVALVAGNPFQMAKSGASQNRHADYPTVWVVRNLQHRSVVSIVLLRPGRRSRSDHEGEAEPERP